MATSPLFVADVATLKAKLRLSGAATPDATAIIDEALLVVRSGFYRELGRSRVDQLRALPFTENPETNDQVLRATANSTEVKWIRAELMRTLPMLFMDASANQQQVYQDEAAFREATQRQLDEERGRLMNDVQQNLDLLSGSQEIHTEASMRFGTIEPKCQRPQPGDSVRPCIPSWLSGRAC